MLNYGNSMKGNITSLLDNYVSEIDDLSLSIAINSFLAVPVSFEEALEFYVALHDVCARGEDSIHEPLCSRLQNEVRDVPPAVLAEKMRNYSLSIRKVLADSIASSLCRQHNTLLEHLKNAVRSNCSAELLALADGASIVVPAVNNDIAPLPYPRRA